MPANAEVPRTPDTTILAADAAAAPTDAGAAPGGVAYADDPGQSAAPGTARIRITARAFTDNPWAAQAQDIAAQSPDARYSQGITFELWSAIEDRRDIWLPTNDYPQGELPSYPRNPNRLALDAIENAGPQQRIDADWARCTTDADGRCDIVVPRDGLNKRYFVRQISDAPGAFHTDDLTWATSNQRVRVSLPGLTGKLQPGRVYTSPAPRTYLAQVPTARRDARGSFGAAAQSIVNPPLDTTQVCEQPASGPTIALVLDTTGSISLSRAEGTLRDAVYGPGGFLENLKGTGVKIASCSFATVSPGSERENDPEPLNIDTDYDTIVARIRDRQLNRIEGLTNWEDGLRAVDENNAKYKYDEVIFVTDGDPNRWSNNPKVDVGTDGSVRGVEAAVYRANRIKEAGTRIVTIGAGFAETDTTWDGEGNLKAISGAVNGADYFATKWTDLAQTLRALAGQFQCPTPISVKKTIVDGTGAELPDQSAANDWAVDVRVDNLAGFVDNGRGKNPSKFPLATLTPNADATDDSDVDTSAAVIRDSGRTAGDTHTARWALSFNAGQKENAHGDVTLSEKTDSKPGYRFVPGRTVDGKTVGSHYRIFDRSTGKTVGRDVLITSPTQTIPNVTRGQGVEAVFANTPEPKISVAKTAKTNEVTVGTDGTFTAEYTVTVTNTADHTAVAEPVGDRPQLPEGWTVRSVSVDGEERTAGGDGTYPVARDLVLDGHATKEYTVAVTGLAPKEFTDGRTPEQCSAENPQGGVRNTVTMGGDTDGDGNNAACVTVIPPAPGRPTVTKTLDSVNRKDDGTATATYTVTVTGDAQRPSWYTLADRPSFAPNVTIDGWTVTAGAGTPEVTPAINGPYTDPGTIVGTDAKIDAGATHTYTVEFRLSGLKDVPTANVVCTPGEDAPGHGLFNEATLTAGTKEQTADACGPVPAIPGALKIVKKIKGNDANDAPGVEVAPGEDMPVTYEVTNTGELPVFDVTVTDKITTEGDKVVDGITVSDEERPKAEKLNRGETVTFTATIKAPATGGTLHTDLAQAHGRPADPNDPTTVDENVTDHTVNSNEDPANATTSAHDGLTIVKKINGDNANDAPGVEVEPGEDMPVTYEVTNTGNRPVFNVNVTDKITTEGDKAVTNITADDRAKAAKLDPGQTVTFSATIKAPATGGTLHTDLAQAHGVPPKPGKPNEPGDPNDPQTPPVNSNEDPANATTKPKDGLKVVKKINGDDANIEPGVAVKPGSDMDVTYEVTNTGNRPLSDVTVTDRIVSENNTEVKGITPEKVDQLKPGETVTFKATIKAPAADGVKHHDVATAHGVPPSPSEPPSPTEPNKPGNPPSSTEPPSPSEPGKPGEPPSPSEPNKPGVPPVNSPEDPGYAHTPPKDSLKLVKKINGDDANNAPGVSVEPGSDMKITYEVTNDGQRPVFNVSVTDKITSENNAEVKDITTATPEKAAKLNPGEKVEFTATIKAPTAGGVLHTDVAKAHGVPPSPSEPPSPTEPGKPGNPPSSTEPPSPSEPGKPGNPPSSTEPPSPDDPNKPAVPPVESNEDPGNATTKPKDGLKLVKKINGDDANNAPGVSVEPGSDMKVTYEVTNTGDRPVFNVSVTDKITTEGGKVVEGITASDPEKAKQLNPNETVEFTATIKAPEAGNKLHTDVAKAYGVPPSPTEPGKPGNPPSSTEPPSPSEPGKPGNPPSSTEPPSPSEPGKPGNPPSSTEPPSPDDPNKPAVPPVESNEDPGNATTKPKDGLKVVKKINGDDANAEPGVEVAPGSDMDVTYEVTNTGDRPLSDVSVTDRIVSENNTEVKGITPEKVDQLKPGETVTFKATIKAPAADGAQHHDVATAHGVPPSPSEPPSPTEPNKPGNPPSSTEPPSPTEPGKPGNPPSSTEPPSPSEPGKPGEPPSPSEPNKPGVPPVNSPEDPGFAHTTPKDSLKLVKKINGDDANTAPGVEVEPGSDMKITYEVTNDGQRPVFNVNVTDKITSENNAEVKDITASDPEKAKRLNPGETVTFTATIKAPAANGVQHHDVAQAHGVPPSPNDPEKPAEPPSPDEPNKPGVPPVDSPEDPGFARTTPKDGLKVVKKINGDDANTAPGVEVKPGSDMNITYEVENTGNRPLFNVSVVDRIATDGNAEVKGISPASVEKLEPGAKVTFTATVKAPEGDNKWHADVARAYGVPPSPTDPSKPGDPNDPRTPPVNSPEDPGNAHTPPPAEPPAPPKRGLKVVKKINGDDANVVPGVEVKPGSDMKVTYEVTNTGDQVLNDVRVVDRIVTESDAPVKGITPEKVDSLKPGETVVFTATIKAPQASATVHHDVAKAIGVPPSGGNKPPSGGVTPPPGGQTPPTGGVTPPPGGQTPPPTGEVTPPPGEGTPPPVESPEDPGFAHTPPPGDKTPPPPVIPIIPIIPILPPLPPVPPAPPAPQVPTPPVPPAPNPPAPQVPAPPAPNAPVPPAPAPQAPTPPAPENNRGGALAKTGVSAGLGYALLAGLVLLAAGAVMFVLGRRRRSEGGDR
ncbi:DUF7507 domain-containing protein [Corynebacterium bovis]|uniref:DUF7507 domain-containing protein n=1 Tax=Corynebacterium bovis TaxID=36808 RepID=UPI001639DED1|nr:FxLYD domain-containing protein [Corynebacterium bovis]